MPVAIDTRVLIAAEKRGAGLRPLLPVGETEFDFDRLKDRIELLRPLENQTPT